MAFKTIIYLIAAVFSGSIALAIWIGGIMSFQSFDHERRITLTEMADMLIFSHIFTTIVMGVEGWSKNEEGRYFIYGGILFSTVTVGFSYLFHIN